MGRYNTTSLARLGATSSLHTIGTATLTHNAAPGQLRDARTELFLAAISDLCSTEGTFYESAADRNGRYRDLLTRVVVEQWTKTQAALAQLEAQIPIRKTREQRIQYATRRAAILTEDSAWLVGFIDYLRNVGNLRSVPVKLAADAVHVRREQGAFSGGRDILKAALVRSDEPGELLAYWTATYGTPVPHVVKRAIADRVSSLYTQRQALKGDHGKAAWRFADVIRMFGGSDQALFKHLIAANPEREPEGLGMIAARNRLFAQSPDQIRAATPGQLAEAGVTWEAYASALQGPMDAAAWEKVIPVMGYFALLRNLRNFDQAGISKAARREVEDKLTSPEEARKSRVLPLRFLSAYRAVTESGTVTGWGPVLEEAANLVMGNVPALPGRTMILVDASWSMFESTLTPRSTVRYGDAAALFGATLALRAEDAFLVKFDNYPVKVVFNTQHSVLPLSRAITSGSHGGTDTPRAISESLANYPRPDRVIILTDEQYNTRSTTVDQELDRSGVRNVFTWNLAGYSAAQGEQGTKGRYAFGGLSDFGFSAISTLEKFRDQSWPWLD